MIGMDATIRSALFVQENSGLCGDFSLATWEQQYSKRGKANSNPNPSNSFVITMDGILRFCSAAEHFAQVSLSDEMKASSLHQQQASVPQRANTPAASPALRAAVSCRVD